MEAVMELSDIRKQIDAIDAELAELFLRRAGLSMQAALFKQEHGLPMVDSGREKEIVERAEAAASDEGMKLAVRRFMEAVLAECRQKQREVTAPKTPPAPIVVDSGSVAYLGPEGSFSHEACLQAFGVGCRALPFPSFEEVVDAVASGKCRYGILPVENSLTGGVFAAADLLAAGAVHIVGETVLAVRHCLLGIPGAVAGDIRTVLSHPQPLEQCRQFIRRRGYDTRACGSTAGAAREVTQKHDITLAAIASEAAGAMNGLEPLLRDIQDNPANFTRFAVVAAGEQADARADKISAVFIVEHRPGTLYGTLRAFANRGVNILNLVSRPVPGSPWQYCFHMDFDGSLNDANVREALAEAQANCRSIRILGNYRRWEACP
jgi:chorismate mutase / prephenate dehydratase